MQKILLSLFAPVCVLLLWFWTTHSGEIPAILLPSPEAVWATGVELLRSGELMDHIAASAKRVAIGFGLALLLSLILCFAFSLYYKAERIARPIIEALRVTPPLALIPLLILWFGIDEAPKIAIVFLSGFFPMYVTLGSALRNTEPKYHELAHVLKLTPQEQFRWITFPASIVPMMAGIRLGFGYSWRALVGAELIAASSGLGFLISESGEYVRTDAVFVGILCIVFIGVAMDWVLRQITKIVTPAGLKCHR